MARSTTTHQPPTPLKILFVAAECAPFYKVGGLADVIGSLPQALRAMGHDVRVVIPRYRPIDAKRYSVKRVDRFIDVPTGDTARTTEVVESNYTGVPTYFVWDERFFGRDKVYGQPDELMADVFFSRAVIEFLRTIDWTPDVLHAHDWHSGPALMYLATRGRREAQFKSIASLLTIHNLYWQGVGGNAPTAPWTALASNLYYTNQFDNTTVCGRTDTVSGNKYKRDRHFRAACLRAG